MLNDAARCPACGGQVEEAELAGESLSLRDRSGGLRGLAIGVPVVATVCCDCGLVNFFSPKHVRDNADDPLHGVGV